MTPHKCGVVHIGFFRTARLGMGFSHCLFIKQRGERSRLLAVKYRLIYIFTLLQLHFEQKQGLSTGRR